jgi:hypothetical protein
MCLVRSGQVLDIFGRLEWKALVDTLEIVCERANDNTWALG